MIQPTPSGTVPKDGRVFGETPKTAVETTALPKATASFRLRSLIQRTELLQKLASKKTGFR